jgi:hypothetical protein
VLVLDMNRSEAMNISVSDKEPIYVGQLPKGNYLIKVITSAKTEVLKFIKE